MDLVLKNARVVDALHNIDDILDIGVEDGRIADLGSSLRNGKKTVDYGGKTVIPGVIDMHVHVTELLGGHVGYYMAAKTGVTTIIDFAGPIEDIVEHAGRLGCGMNVGCLDTVHPGQCGADPSEANVESFLQRSLEQGALGLKILGGHFPLTPEASGHCISAANKRKVLVAFHAGSTKERSDILGIREAVELAQGKRMILAHINAYCRGKHDHYLEELRDAFEMLRRNPNIISDSHMAVMNGTSGICKDGAPHDAITANCLLMFGREPTEEALERAILDGLVRVIAPMHRENALLKGEEAHRYWRDRDTNANISFPANLAQVAVACVVERVTRGGDFLIPLTATDGGGFPRNDLIGRLLSLCRMGYISLEDVIRKASLNPAKIFGLWNKGHLGIGADADLTVLNEQLTAPVASFARGKQIMEKGEVIGTGGCIITTEEGVKKASSRGLEYSVADVENSAFHTNF